MIEHSHKAQIKFIALLCENCQCVVQCYESWKKRIGSLWLVSISQKLFHAALLYASGGCERGRGVAKRLGASGIRTPSVTVWRTKQQWRRRLAKWGRNYLQFIEGNHNAYELPELPSCSWSVVVATVTRFLTASVHGVEVLFSSLLSHEMPFLSWDCVNKNAALAMLLCLQRVS